MSKEKKIDIKEGYNLWSSEYDKTENMVLKTEGDIPLELMGKTKGKKILDAGCGTGRWSIRLAKSGAELYGIDFSEGMISEAKKKAEDKNLNIDFKVHDLKEEFPFEDHFFDIILCSTVIESIQEIEPVFKEFSRTLKKDGILVITTIQPLLREREAASFKIEGIKYKIPDKVDHSFEDYFHLLKQNGFVIDDIREPKEEGTKYPLLLIIKARKVD